MSITYCLPNFVTYSEFGLNLRRQDEMTFQTYRISFATI